MATDREPRKIMTKPLPQILDEIEDSIRLADEAAKNAREAAVEARESGVKAADEATRIANERLNSIEQIAKNALALAEAMKLIILDGAASVNKRLSESVEDTENT